MKKEHLDNLYLNCMKDEQEIFGITLPMTLLYKHLFNEGTSILQHTFGLSHSEMDVLAALYFNGKTMSPTDLYEATIFSSGGMTKVLKKLQEKGFISRVPSDKDKRSMLVHIEHEGEEMVEKSIKLLVEKDNEVFDILDSNEKEFMLKIFKKLVYSLFQKE
ncbi:MarR family transcriptional regulator [bacterium]|nr:MarR family transcriptional regulator [bacterium]MBU1959356.1 MarR family transcriptional regulator [bacterium]